MREDFIEDVDTILHEEKLKMNHENEKNLLRNNTNQRVRIFNIKKEDKGEEEEEVELLEEIEEEIDPLREIMKGMRNFLIREEEDHLKERTIMMIKVPVETQKRSISIKNNKTLKPIMR